MKLVHTKEIKAKKFKDETLSELKKTMMGKAQDTKHYAEGLLSFKGRIYVL